MFLTGGGGGDTPMLTMIETSQLICRANQLTGFYMMRTLVVKRLINFLKILILTLNSP